MKRILIVLLVVFLIFGLMGCRKAQENAVENMIEGMMESQSGEDVDVDIDDDGGNITISGDDGEVNIQGDEDGMPWPSDKLPNNVPRVKGVKVVSIMDVGTGIYVVFENCTGAIAEDYIKDVENNGWEITMNMDSEGTHIIMATNSNEEMLQFAWDEEDGGGEITYGQQ